MTSVVLPTITSMLIVLYFGIEWAYPHFLQILPINLEDWRARATPNQHEPERPKRKLLTKKSAASSCSTTEMSPPNKKRKNPKKKEKKREHVRFEVSLRDGFDWLMDNYGFVCQRRTMDMQIKHLKLSQLVSFIILDSCQYSSSNTSLLASTLHPRQ